MSSASASDKVVVVTGASRGLGLEWVKQYAQEPKTFVVAVARSQTDGLSQLASGGKNIAVVDNVDLEDFASFNEVAQRISKVTGGKVDILINNAGAWFGSGSRMQGRVDESTVDEWRKTYDLNTISPIFFTIALLPLLRKGQEKKIVNVDSFLGWPGFTKATDGGFKYASYAAAKGALQIATEKMHYDHRDEGLIFITSNPGFVGTDLHVEGKDKAPLTPAQSVSRQKTWVDKVTTKESGGHYSLDGAEQPLTH